MLPLSQSGASKGINPGSDLDEIGKVHQVPSLIDIKQSSSTLPFTSHPIPHVGPTFPNTIASGTALVKPASRGSRIKRFFRDKSAVVPEDPLGLLPVHEGSDFEVDFVFVHGLGGSSRKTWSWNHDPANFWPAWIRHEEGFSRIRVFTFGYNANFRDSVSRHSILDFSKSLLVHMRAYRQGTDESSDIGTKPIVFVAHSMGGLVVKKALMIGKTQDQYSSLTSNVRGIMFLSTPHRGSAHASALNNLLSVVAGSSAKVYISELDPSSTSIEDINEQFRAICASWELISMYETRVTKISRGIKRMIVDKTSGILGYPQETTVPVEADHHTICKFENRLDPRYRLFIDLLRKLMSPTNPQDMRLGAIGPSDKEKEGANYMSILGNMLGAIETPRDDLESHLTSARPGSCKWFQQNENFRSWLGASEQKLRVLWLTGLPGTGKSTLAAKTINHIQQAPDKPSCQYHFFTETQPTKQTVSYCLRSIAFQLARSHDAFADKLVQLHQETGFIAVGRKFIVIWEAIFENIVFKMDFGHTLHWVFDGLDEANTPRDLIRNLVQMSPQTFIKILFISRPERDLTILMTARLGRDFLIQLSIPDTQRDIEDCITSEIKEILSTDGETHDHVIQQLQNRAEGSFLWAKLALDTLRDHWHTEADINMVLDNVPTGMDSLYKQMMANITNQSPRHQDLAIRILAWATCAFHPLTIPELTAALQPEFDGFISLPETILKICGQFIHVDDGRLSLIHATARHFLLNNMPFISDNSGSRQRACHNTLATACLRYLSQDHWRRTLLLLSEQQTAAIDVSSDPQLDKLQPLYGTYPLLQYAMNHWAYHISQASVDNPDLLTSIQGFCDKYILQWIHAVSLTTKLENLPSAARHLRAWISRRRRQVQLDSPSPDSLALKMSKAKFVEEWAVDLIHIVGKFGPNLVQSPLSIYKNIPPLCPSGSIVSRTYCRVDDQVDLNSLNTQLLSVKGLVTEHWDDNLARLSVGDDECASAVRCAGNYFLALVQFNGTVIVWHKETCEEVHRLHHGEWATLLSTDKAGRLVATAGQLTFCIWELKTGSQLYKVPKTNPGRTLSMKFAADGGVKLVMGYDDCTVTNYDLETAHEQSIFSEPNQKDSVLGSCPRFIFPSPDETKVAICFPGRPLAVWDMSAVRSQQQHSRLAPPNSIPTKIMPKLYIRKGDKDLEVDGKDTFIPTETVRWHPTDSSILYILYHDTAIVMWDLAEDSQIERKYTGARGIALNSDGTLLLTSDNTGGVRIWTLPDFNLIYELKADEFVRVLAFSPDSQRIYDVRGSSCNVWAPDILVRPDSIDGDEIFKGGEGSGVSEISAVSVPANSQNTARSQVTALIGDNNDEFFCVGRDDGSVNIHAISDGKVVRKAYKHSATSEVTMIEWSSSGRFIASADDCSKVIVKRLGIKENGKWAVFPLFELRVGDIVTQLLFSQHESFLLISTDTSDRVWDVKTKNEVCNRKREEPETSRWIHHPDDSTRLIWLSSSQLRIHTWPGLDEETGDHGIAEPEGEECEVKGKDRETPCKAADLPFPPPEPVESEIITKVIQPKNHQYILYESHPRKPKDRTSDKSTLHILHLRNRTSHLLLIDRKPLADLSNKVRYLLGCVGNRLVFIDHENWVCTTSALAGSDASINRHFFLPRVWVNDLAIHVVTKKGTFLSSRNGEVAVLRYERGF